MNYYWKIFNVAQIVEIIEFRKNYDEMDHARSLFLARTFGILP